MKKLASVFLLVVSTMGFSSVSMADGCNVWGPVSFVYVTDDGTTAGVATLINGMFCLKSGTSGSANGAAAVLAEAMGSGLTGYLSGSSGVIIASSQ